MDNRPTDGPILIESPAEREARERAAEQRQDRRHRKLQLWFNGALMFATLATVGIVLYQNRILNFTLQEMVRQTPELTRSADAAKAAANAAEVAARAAENQLPIQLGQMDIAREQMADTNRVSSDALQVARDANKQSAEATRLAMSR